jgi:microcystin-dependent protein
MADPYVAEIRIFPFNFPPIGWAFCNGQLLSIAQNTALFSLIGTFYGGDGVSNFALPNLQGASPLAMGQGAGLSNYVLGESGGETAVTVLASQMPSHTHGVTAVQGAANQTTPTGNTWAEMGRTTDLYSSPPSTGMSPQATSSIGGNQPHNNMPQYLVLNFCIALVGVYPARN